MGIRLFLLFLLCYWPLTLKAEFLCHCEINFTLKKGEQVITYPWSRLESKGGTAEEAKKVLENKIIFEKKKAEAACSEKYGSTGECAASKLSANAALMAQLDFQTRKKLQEHLVEECVKSSGECAPIEKVEIVCEEKQTAAPTDSSTATAPADAAKKDAKKK